MNGQQIWRAALRELQSRVSKANYDTWLRNTRALSMRDGTLTVDVPNSFAKEWIEGRLRPEIAGALSRVVGNPLQLEVVVSAAASKTGSRPATTVEETAAPAEASPGGLPTAPWSDGWSPNPRYTFDAFVVGNGNRLAHGACLAVAHSPARAYNPLFVYGGVGLGKTHLLHAIAHVAIAQGLRPVYTTSEQFTNELIAAITDRRTEEFRQRYRRVDILLIDDIAFIAGKERTQEEFFHTFNALHQADRQIVLTSDRPPKAIFTLEERLRSRFEGGLIADIQPPDFETRVAILHSRCDRRSALVSNQVLELIAQRVPTNIRELEGALIRVLALASLNRAPATVQLAETALSDLALNPVRRFITPELVLQAVGRYFQVDIKALKGKRRVRDIVRPRQVAMFLLREEAGCSTIQAGRELGGRDHSTVVHGYDRVKGEMEADGQLRRDIITIRELIYASAKP